MKEADHTDPPKSAERFFQWYCKNDLQESILGDLDERFEDYLSRYSKRKSKWLYWLDVVRFLNRHTLKRKGTQNRLIGPTMFKNYTIVALRNIKRNKGFTAINVLGLAVSMAICLVIIVMINDQLSYDAFQSKRDQTYRITHRRLNDDIKLPMATSPAPLADKLNNEYPGVSNVVIFRRGLSGEVLDEGKVININGMFTNPAFFDLFDYHLATGDEQTALSQPYSIVLKKETAEKFFRDADPMGQTLDIEGLGQFTVTGVLEEVPGKTHIHFEALSSFSTVPLLETQDILAKATDNWESTSWCWTYFQLPEDHQLAPLQAYLDELADEFYNEDSRYIVKFGIQSMTNITPGPLMGNQIGQTMPNFFVYGLVILAVLIMICAAFNYANLTTARALTRFKEIGVRKVMGSSRGQVVLQFVIEAIIISIFSLILAMGFLRLLIPAFEGLNLSTLLEWRLEPDAYTYFQFFFFSILTGLITGVFPSLYMSRAKAISALKGVETPKLSKINLRKSLIVTQLVISIVLVVSSSLVYRQIQFMIDKDYGFNKENIVNIALQGQDFKLLKPKLTQLSFVERVSGANNIPSTGHHSDEDVRLKMTDEPLSFNYYSVDEDYLESLDLELIQGSNFTPNQAQEREVILNEKAVEALGWSDREQVIGENIIIGDSLIVQVVGVVEDYNFMMLYMEIEPMMLRYNPENFRWAQVKLSSTNGLEEIESLEATWNDFDANHDFEYHFFDDQVADFYAMFYDIVYIIGLISVLSIVIAGMGLLGIATYSIRIRLKEVGIRKILGATGRDLMLLLSRSFLIMIVVSTIIGGLISFFGNKAWLDLFAYRVSFGLDILGIAFGFIVIIGGLTIGSQTWRAMGTNPSEILRNE